MVLAGAVVEVRVGEVVAGRGVPAAEDLAVVADPVAVRVRAAGRVRSGVVVRGLRICAIVGEVADAVEVRIGCARTVYRVVVVAGVCVRAVVQIPEAVQPAGAVHRLLRSAEGAEGVVADAVAVFVGVVRDFQHAGEV